MPTAQRLLDTRQSTPLAAGGSLSVSVTGVAPLPAPGTVVAAVLNLTVTGPAGTGYWTVWPHTSARPEASNLNVDEQQALARNAIPNLVTVPVGADGVVDVFASAGGNVIVDLLGYYTAADSATAGRFQPLAGTHPRARHPQRQHVQGGRGPQLRRAGRGGRQRRRRQPHRGHRGARLLAGVPAGRRPAVHLQPELADRLPGRRGQPGDRHRRSVRAASRSSPRTEAT